MNLAHKDFASDLIAILNRCHEANVTSLILTGTSLKSSRDCLALCKEHNGKELHLEATVGCHPHDASKYQHEPTMKLVRSSGVSIVGEWCVKKKK